MLSNRTQDLLRRDADIAVRMVAPTQEALIARRIGVIPISLFAHKDYLAQHAPPRRPADLLAGHTLIGADHERGPIEALKGIRVSTTARDFAIRTDSHVAQLAALRAGIGIGVCQVPLAARHPELVRVLPAVSFPLETWVVMHEDLGRMKRVRLVFDDLVEKLGVYVKGAAVVRRQRR